MPEPKLIIGILGMPDNLSTPQLLRDMRQAGIEIDFVIYWKPSLKDQWKRLRRKLRLGGIGPTLQRVAYAVQSRLSRRSRPAASSTETPGDGLPKCREYFVPGHNSAQCREILKRESVDILLLATDAMIGRGTLQIPRLATLNAHPGWIPRFRGLGSIYFQMEQGYFPSVSVHQVDEGVDTGPLILRATCQVTPGQSLDEIEESVSKLQHETFAKVIRMFQGGHVEYIDTFGQPSNMTQGMPLKRRRKLEARIKAGELKLRELAEEA